MKLTCSACGAVLSLDALLGHEGAREAVMIALALPAPLGKLLVQYLGLFRPASRNLSMDRLASLLGELQPLIADAKIERNGRIWSAPLDYWQMALTEMIAKRDSLTLPLKTHGYLLAIIEGYNLKAEQRKETASEAHKAGITQTGGGASSISVEQVLGKRPSGPRSAMPESIKQGLSKFKTKGGNGDDQ